MLCRFGLASSRISVIGGITVPMADHGWTRRSSGNRRPSSVGPDGRRIPGKDVRRCLARRNGDQLGPHSPHSVLSFVADSSRTPAAIREMPLTA